jgi:two-component system sensor histidine kinase KdpD
MADEASGRIERSSLLWVGSMRIAGRLALQILISLGLVAAITVTFVRLIHANATTVGFSYLIVILMIASTWGFIESTVASVVAMLCFNYFFFPPIGTFAVADPHSWVALFAFLATSLTASQLSVRAKRRTKEAVDRQREIERLYTLSRSILLTEPTQPLAKQIARQIAQLFGFSVVAVYDRNSGETYRSDSGGLPDIEAKLRNAALQSAVFEDPTGKVIVTPVRLGAESIGSLALQGASLSDAALQSLLNLVAIALEKVRAQEAVNRAEVTRQSEELKSTLLDAIAHELKTPLTSIKAVTTDLLDPASGLQQQYRELVTIADGGADRLSRLVTEAIQLARIEGGKFTLNKEIHFPSSLVSGVLRQMKSLTEGRDIKLDVPEELPAVMVDAELVQMVIRQLIDNALKYSPAAGSITIRAQAVNGQMNISVSDQGPGIPQSEQARIFERFYRNVKDHPRIKGTGMGLTIAREILRAHGCEIWVKSIPGKGSEFCFSLPIAPKERAA